MPQIDEISEQGLKGLSRILVDRTSVEPGEPVGIDIETRRDRVLPAALLAGARRRGSRPPPPLSPARHLYEERRHHLLRSPRGRRRLSTRLSGDAVGVAEALRRMLAKLDIPPLEPVPPDHVLTKAFYLLQILPRPL